MYHQLDILTDNLKFYFNYSYVVRIKIIISKLGRPGNKNKKMDSDIDLKKRTKQDDKAIFFIQMSLEI